MVIELFPFQVVGTLKPSIEYASLPFTPLRSLCPLCSLKPSKQYALLPLLLFALSSLAPTEVVGTLKPSIQYALLPLPLDPLTPCLHRGGGDPKTVYNILCPLCSPLPPHPLPLQRGWGPMKAFCSTVSVHVVVVLFAGGGDI